MSFFNKSRHLNVSSPHRLYALSSLNSVWPSSTHTVVLYIQLKGLSASVSEGEDSKRFVRRRAPVNNLTSQGVKGQGSCIHWKILKALLGFILLYLAEAPRLKIISHRHKLTHRLLFLFSLIPSWISRLPSSWPNQSIMLARLDEDLNSGFLTFKKAQYVIPATWGMWKQKM